MLNVNDFMNIFLPVLSHWIVWLIFLLVVAVVLGVYAYPYVKKPGKEFHYQHVSIPIVSIISLYIFTKMFEGYLYSGSILKVDLWVNGFVYSPFITSIASFITNFGGGVLVSIFFIVVVGALSLRKRWRYALISAVALGGATVLQVVIKGLVQRARPENLIETGFSFPSGHAITAIVFVSLLIYSFKDDFKNRIARYVLIYFASVFFILVGISRLVLHVHWFSDVMAGMSLGLFWFMLLVLVERAIPGLKKAVKVETKEAKPIVPKAVVETAKAIVPGVAKK